MDGDRTMTTTYFSSDGSYGDASNIVLAKTDDWTPAMWQAIDEAGDYDRVELAEHFMTEWHDFEEGSGDFFCATCNLTPRELPKEENE